MSTGWATHTLPPCFALIRDSSVGPHAGLQCRTRTTMKTDCVYEEEEGGRRIKHCHEMLTTFRSCVGSPEVVVSTSSKETREDMDLTSAAPDPLAEPSASCSDRTASSSAAASTASSELLTSDVGHMLTEFLAFASELKRKHGIAGDGEASCQDSSASTPLRPQAPSLVARLFGWRHTPQSQGLTASGQQQDGQLAEGQRHRQFSYVTQDI